MLSFIPALQESRGDGGYGEQLNAVCCPAVSGRSGGPVCQSISSHSTELARAGTGLSSQDVKGIMACASRDCWLAFLVAVYEPLCAGVVTEGCLHCRSGDNAPSFTFGNLAVDRGRCAAWIRV